MVEGVEFLCASLEGGKETEMKRFVLTALVVGLAFVVTNAYALSLQPSVTTTQTWGVGDLDENGDPYWDGNSSDLNPNPANIGNWLTNTGAFTGGSGPGVAYSYVGTSSSGDLNIYFTSTNPNWAAIRIEVAGLDDYNYFGIYRKDAVVSPNDLLGVSSADHVRLFVGGDSAGAIKTFTPPWTDFGWYLAAEDKNNPGTALWAWFSQSSLNSIAADKTFQHFAFFEVRKNEAYYIGVEDKPLNSSDKDYQDFVVYAAVVPDASTWMLFLSGVPAVLMLRRRKA